MSIASTDTPKRRAIRVGLNPLYTMSLTAQSGISSAAANLLAIFSSIISGADSSRSRTL